MGLCPHLSAELCSGPSRSANWSRKPSSLRRLARSCRLASGLIWRAHRCGGHPRRPVHLDWRPIVYALLSLTVVRMIPVALSMIGTGLRLGHGGVDGLVWPAWLSIGGVRFAGHIDFDEAGQTIEPLVATVGPGRSFSACLPTVCRPSRLVGWYSRRLEAAEAAHTELEETPEMQSRRQMLMGHRLSSRPAQRPDRLLCSRTNRSARGSLAGEILS